jgi:hypothetical protein
MRGHTRIQPNPKHFHRRPSLAKTLFVFAVPEARLAAISDDPICQAII